MKYMLTDQQTNRKSILVVVITKILCQKALKMTLNKALSINLSHTDFNFQLSLHIIL